uniref:Uncharacterized protein n=1 Tax=Eustigmatophyceae sp. Chic 10/23 P-6w TaxID=1446905 RepID=A0A3R5U494_9STRA|nr:hypothetical protein Ycf60 [Eustigmatophyceae sp. Chic 10/23 P-6w]QAA11550.1 hypothetical protein Ycf60 [Eustigmatophyceae sp. Chic 10/23 P-6w]
MTKFSQKTIQKLKLHLGKLKDSVEVYKSDQHSQEIKDKKFHQYKTFIKNRNVAKALLIESIFLNLKILNFNRSSLFIKFILKNKKVFTSKEMNSNSYLLIKLPTISAKNKRGLEESLNKIIRHIINGILVSTNKLEKLGIVSSDKFKKYSNSMKIRVKKWHLYISRFFILTLIHFIPFVQLTTKLFYTYPNPLIANSVTSSLFHIFPLFMHLIKITGTFINNETFSFLLIGFYYKLFIISYKKYGIPRKLAFQGTFAISLMLINYCIVMSNEITTLIYKFVKRFFFFTKAQRMDLLRDDINFFIDDLEDLRYYKETFLQWGESIFSLDDISKTIKINESLTIIPALGVIALLYNYVYFILRGEKPIIPVVTKTVRRMMVDRNSDEF